MKRLMISVFLSAVPFTPSFAGDLWQWAPGHWTYTDDHGHTWDGFRWAPGHVTWTDSRGHSREVWEWAPGHWSVDENQ